MAAALVASGLKRGLEDIAKALTDCVDASTGFESAMAGVAKTTNLSDSELSAMGNQIKQLSTEIPIANTELAGIVETAGQLGISKENLVEFATVMANLGVATNLTADEAATMLARFANVTKMSPDLYENLGSVVVALGNNFATTESEIVSMGQRLAAAGKLAGMTEPEIMALATAMSSVGIEAEAGGSAMSQTMSVIEKAVATGGDDVKKFAEISGMSAQDFSSAWESKPAEAIQAFITGLGSLDEKGESATLVLDDLGLSGIRQENMLKSLGLASDVLASSINVANAAWADNTALAKEASTRYETTESKMAMFKNSVVNLKVAVGDQLTPALGNLAEKGNDVVEWATEFTQSNEWLAPTIVAVTTALTTLTVIVGGTIATIKIIKPLIEALNGTLVANPVFLVAAGITAVTTALIALAATTPSVTQEADRLNDAMNDTAKTFEAVEETYESTSKNIDATAKVVDAYIDRLVNLEKQSSLTNEEQDEYKRLVGQIAELLPEANTAINENTGFLEEGAAALHKNVEEWKLMAQNAANASRIKAMSDSLTNAYIDLYTAQDTLTEKQNSASDGALQYADALTKLYAAQDSYVADEGTYAQVEAAQDAVLESMQGLDKEQRNEGESIAALRDEIAKASETVELYNEKIKALNESIENAGDNLGESAADAGSKVREGYQSEVDGMAEDTGKALSEVNDKIENAAPDAYSGGQAVGAALAQGAAIGISDNAAAVAAQAAKMVTDAILAAKKAADSNSPSKKTMKLGRDLDEGVVIGVKEKESEVLDTISSLISKIDSVSRMQIPEIPQSQPLPVMSDNSASEALLLRATQGIKSSSGAGQSPKLGTTNNIVLNAQTISEDTIDYIYQRFNDRLGKGL